MYRINVYVTVVKSPWKSCKNTATYYVYMTPVHRHIWYNERCAAPHPCKCASLNWDGFTSCIVANILYQQIFHTYKFEVALFWQMLLNKKSYLKGRQCMLWRKNEKGSHCCTYGWFVETAAFNYQQEQITSVLQGCKRPSDRYTLYKKAGITVNIFTEWHQSLDAKLEMLHRRICLVGVGFLLMAFQDSASGQNKSDPNFH